MNNATSTDKLKQLWLLTRPYVFALGLAFLFTGIMLGLLGFNVWEAFKALITTSFSSKFQIVETFKKFTPLVLTTFAFAIPFQIKFFNIGSTGQMIMGGTIATMLGLGMSSFRVPSALAIILILTAAALTGALYALIAGALKAYHNINPIISTIMLNFVAMQFTNFVATTPPWQAPLTGHPMSKELPKWMLLPRLFSELHIGFLIALGMVAFVYFIMKKTVIGYEIESVGHNQRAAEIHGINIKKTTLVTFFLGGLLAGLAGGIEVLGVHGRLVEGFAVTSGAEYGTFGTLTALISGAEPLAVPAVAFLMSILLNGADSLQRRLMVPVELVFLTQALIVILVVTMRERFRKR